MKMRLLLAGGSFSRKILLLASIKLLKIHKCNISTCYRKWPSLNTPQVLYRYSIPASCKSHFEAISAEAQKLSIALRRVRVCNPTVVCEDNILSMAFAQLIWTLATLWTTTTKILTNTSGVCLTPGKFFVGTQMISAHQAIKASSLMRVSEFKGDGRYR